MTQTSYYLFTGSTSGLGLEAATQLAMAHPSSVIIAGVRQPAQIEALRRAISQDQLIALECDTSSLASVKSFATEVKAILMGNTLSGVALNAGIQIVSGDQYSIDGYELTFATNVLGHIVLFEQLESALSASAVVLSTASGTHDKDYKLAKPYKFYGGYFPSAADVARAVFLRVLIKRR
jgi:NAD(P)-dependent dehydrogenase (short-subunit alcohol dehydrogenase family)